MVRYNIHQASARPIWSATAYSMHETDLRDLFMKVRNQTECAEEIDRRKPTQATDDMGWQAGSVHAAHGEQGCETAPRGLNNGTPS